MVTKLERFKICPQCGGRMSIATTGVCWECHKSRKHEKKKEVEVEVSGHTHYWIVDGNDVGICECGQTKDFGKLQKEVRRRHGN